MSSALVKSGHSFIAAPLQFTPDDVNTIRLNYAAGFTEPEFSMCIRAASLLGANPLLREVHFLKQKYQDRQGNWISKVTIQIGIDFYRRRLMETGLCKTYRVEYCGPDADHWFKVLPRGIELWAARCVLKMDGMEEPVERMAMWTEFGAPAQAKNPIWREKQCHMLGKVVESHAIRLVCAGLLSGTVTEDEIDVMGDTITVDVSETPKPPRQALPAPTPGQTAQSPAPAGSPNPTDAPGAKSPDQAKRDVLSVEIRDFMKRIDGQDAARVKATVERMKDPGPYARTWPAFDKWSTNQLEELVSLYESLESGEAAPEEQAQPDQSDAIEAEVSPVKEEPTPEVTEEQAEAEALADEVAPKKPETDADGKPKAPF